MSRLVELLLDAEGEEAPLEENICSILSRLPFQENEAVVLHSAGGVHALSARISSASSISTKRNALNAIANLALFPPTRSAILGVSAF